MYIKRNASILIAFALIKVGTFLHAAEFNPEHYEFSKQETIKSWIAPEYRNNYIVMKEVQEYIAGRMPANTNGLKQNNVTFHVRNNDGDGRYYGRTFPLIEAPQLSLLKDIRACCDADENEITVLEVGSANGQFSFLIALALGDKGKLVVNDLSKYEIEKAKFFFQNNGIIPLSNIIFDDGDAKTLLQRMPFLEGKVNYSYMQNVEHFCNKVEHQALLTEMLRVLAIDGKAFFTAHTIPVGYGKKGHKFFDKYIELKKKGELYPMYLKVVKTVYEYADLPGAFIPDMEQLHSIEVPEEDVICGSKAEIQENEYVSNRYQSNVLATKIRQENILNCFTPTIYTNAFNEAAKNINAIVQKEGGCFVDGSGKAYSEFSNDKYLLFASIVMKKIQ